MARPLIGITTRTATNSTGTIPMIASPRSYTEALLHAGAVPVLVPLNLPAEPRAELLDRLDGIVFSGGGDITLAYFDGVPHERVYGEDNERDEMEFGFLEQVKEREKPLLGICRGLQVINVAHGGTLYTHINDQLAGSLKHDYFPDYPWDLHAHPVQIDEGSALAEIVGEPLIEVNSLHHQGVETLGNGLHATAHAPDGIIEAIEIDDYPFGIAVQWHPEWMPGDAAAEAIIGALVHASARTANGR